MGNLLDKMLTAVGWEAEEETGESLKFMSEKENKPIPKKQTSSNKVVNLHENATTTLNVMQPDSFEDAREICSCLRSNKVVVINLENIHRDLAQRIVDFISGAVYSLDGNIKKISAGIFVVTPASCIIEDSKPNDFRQELKDRTVMPWME
ncbi:MAG: cell division protein SepF [Clostridia bacterium]